MFSFSPPLGGACFPPAVFCIPPVCGPPPCRGFVPDAPPGSLPGTCRTPPERQSPRLRERPVWLLRAHSPGKRRSWTWSFMVQLYPMQFGFECNQEFCQPRESSFPASRVPVNIPAVAINRRMQITSAIINSGLGRFVCVYREGEF